MFNPTSIDQKNKACQGFSARWGVGGGGVGWVERGEGRGHGYVGGGGGGV